MPAQMPIEQMTLPELRRSILLQWQEMKAFRDKVEQLDIGGCSDEEVTDLVREMTVRYNNMNLTNACIGSLAEEEAK